MEFIAGVEAELATRSVALTIQLVRDVHEEIAVYRRWWGEHRVDGVLMVDLRVDDPRVDELARLGLPAVVVGGPLENGALPAVCHDEGSVVVEAVQYLAALGHARIAQVTGVGEFVHTLQRRAAFTRATADLGLRGDIVETDYSAERARARRASCCRSPSPPSAIVFDSDLLAVTGLGVAQQMGFSVPDDVSIVGWDDSLISQVVHPPLTAITRDIEAFGVACTRQLLAAVDGTADGDVETTAASSRRAAAPAAPAAQRLTSRRVNESSISA